MTQKLLSKPTRTGVKQDFRRADEPPLLVRKPWSRGWTAILARSLRRAGRR